MTKAGRKEEARRWILQSRFDLKAAEWNLEGGFFNTVCFLAQQGAEKALKSVLYYGGVSRRKLMTHSTVQLLLEAKSIVPALSELLDNARELDLHYIPARYPNGLPGGFPHKFYGKKIACEAVEHGQKIVQCTLDFYRSQDFDVDET
jgi:HEPN domain-containing protein